jgi:hypothetical protein
MAAEHASDELFPLAIVKDEARRAIEARECGQSQAELSLDLGISVSHADVTVCGLAGLPCTPFSDGNGAGPPLQSGATRELRYSGIASESDFLGLVGMQADGVTLAHSSEQGGGQSREIALSWSALEEVADDDNGVWRLVSSGTLERVQVCTFPSNPVVCSSRRVGALTACRAGRRRSSPLAPGVPSPCFRLNPEPLPPPSSPASPCTDSGREWTLATTPIAR